VARTATSRATTVLLFHGEERFLIDEAARATLDGWKPELVSDFGFETLEGTGLTPARLQDSILQAPFLDPFRAVYVRMLTAQRADAHISTVHSAHDVMVSHPGRLDDPRCRQSRWLGAEPSPTVMRQGHRRRRPQAQSLACGLVVSGRGRLVVSTLGVIATIVIIPVLSIYLMFEVPDMRGALVEFVPPGARAKALAIINDFDAVLGGFIRGQLLVGAVIGTAITIIQAATRREDVQVVRRRRAA